MADESLVPALVGAAFGVAVSGVVQVAARRWRIGRARKALRVDLGMLLRHIDASLKSLDISPESPVYILTARLRYARFEDLMLTRDRLELIEALQEQERARLLIASIRNSDILLEEIASQIGELGMEARASALEDARLNLRILRETIEHLRLDEVASKPRMSAEMADQVRTRLTEKDLHASAEQGD